MLERCVHQLMQVGPRPDVVLVTGDLVDFGKPEEYALLKRLLAPIDVPLYWHHWRNGGELLAELTQQLQRCAGQWLVPPG